MSSFLIVGAGFSGLLAARLLLKHGFDFVGLEKSGILGGRIGIGHHRIYSYRTVEFLNKIAPELTWELVDEEPRERKNREWHPIGGGYTAAEYFYLRKPFFYPGNSLNQFVISLQLELRNRFHLQKKIRSFNEDSSTIVCEGGDEYGFERLLWCAPIDVFIRALREKIDPKLNCLRRPQTSHGGIYIQHFLSRQLIHSKNTVATRIRYKGKNVTVLGFPSFNEDSSLAQELGWLIFFDEATLKDKEEIAKMLCAVRRSLFKEFPEIENLICSEKLTYLPRISGDVATEVPSIQLLPKVQFIGPQIRESGTDTKLINLDLICHQLIELESNLAIR